MIPVCCPSCKLSFAWRKLKDHAYGKCKLDENVLCLKTGYCKKWEQETWGPRP